MFRKTEKSTGVKETSKSKPGMTDDEILAFIAYGKEDDVIPTELLGTVFGINLWLIVRTLARSLYELRREYDVEHNADD
jgi:hypothetical protein